MRNIVIIGNGISGITAARHLRKKGEDQITVISKETDYFFSRTALMYIYMGHMEFKNTQPYEPFFWKKNRIDLKRAFVQSIDTNQKSLALDDGSQMSYDILILACGSKPNKFGWPGQDLKGVGGLYSYQDLERIEEYSKDLRHAVIVGGGLIGIELAEMFHSRHIPVTFLVREKSFWNNVLPPGESDMINRHIYGNGIDLRLETELKEIVSDENGAAKAVITNKGDEIPCQFVGLTAGVSPNIDFIKGGEIETARGILIDHHFRTSVPDVYAIGDCAQFRDPLPGRRPLEQVWYTGRMHGETLAHSLCVKETAYKPGYWFNSAKFFDIEYQTYGTVLNQNPDGQASLYWEHEDGKKCLHLVYEKDTMKFIGINTFGLRLRHDVFDKWLNKSATLEHVVNHFDEANFDPEFYARYENDLIATYNQQFPNQPLAKKKVGFFAKLFN